MSYASRNSSYLLGSIGAVLQVFAGWWDVYSHILFGAVDPWWNPAHLTLYFGVGVVIVAVWRGLRNKSRPPKIGPIRFVNVAGLKLAGVGSVIQIIAGIWNEVVHHIIKYEPKVAPAHALLVVGMLTINLGMLVGLSVEYGMIKRDILVVDTLKRALTFILLVLLFASVWLATAGSLIFVARLFHSPQDRWVLSILMSISATLVLVPAKRVLPNLGTAGLISLVFNAFGYFMLVIYLGNSYYVPIGMLPGFIFDVLVICFSIRLPHHQVTLLTSVIFGSLFYVTYYPYSAYLFPGTVNPLVVVSLMLGSLFGALIGDKIFNLFSSAVLGETLQYVR